MQVQNTGLAYINFNIIAIKIINVNSIFSVNYHKIKNQKIQNYKIN